MPYGINIYNAANNIIISQDFSNYHVVSSGTIANGGSWPTVPSTDVIFIRANTPGAIISNDGSFATVSSGLIEYVIVRRSPSPSSSSFGLRVYQSDGISIAFDSGVAAAKIVSSLTRLGQSNGLYTSYSTIINQPFAVPAGRKRYMTGQVFMDWSHIYILNFIPGIGTDKLTWTSDMQQTVGTGFTGGFGNKYDLFSTKIFLTIDI